MPLSPPSINLQELSERVQPVVDVRSVSSIAGADDPEPRGYIYWPNQLARQQLTNLDLKEVRKRSQWLCMNTAARVLRRLARYVGVSKVMADTTDKDFNAAVNLWWKEEFQKKTGYEKSGKYTADGYLTTCLYQCWRDGDVLSLHLTDADGSPTCASIEAARIDNPFNQLDHRWQDGVLTDFYYGHHSYSISVDPPGSLWTQQFNQYVTIPSGHCYFFADFETPASTRGTPALIHAVGDLLDEREIDNAVKTTVKNHALLGIYFERDIAATNGAGIQSRVHSGPIRTEQTASTTPATGGTKVENRKRTVAEAISDANLVQGEPGFKAKILNDGRDHPDESPIRNSIYRKLALGMGLPVEVFILLDQLTGPGVRFVLRQTQEWREHWQCHMERFQTVDYMRRVEFAMRTGRLPKCKDANFLRHYFVKPRAITIDDGRTASAQVSALFAGITNLSEIYGEKGDDWRPETTQSIEELAFIESECKRLGVEPAVYFNRQVAALQMALADIQAQNVATGNDQKQAA